MMLFGFYEGLSWKSRMIMWETRSHKSHISVIQMNNSVFDYPTETIRWANLQNELHQCRIWESWGRDGIVRRTGIHEGHTPGTPLTILRLNNDANRRFNEQAAVRFMEQCVEKGIKYDWWGIVRFAIRINRQNPNRMFCSEFAQHASEHANCPLLMRVKGPHFVSPADQYHTPILLHFYSTTTGVTV